MPVINSVSKGGKGGGDIVDALTPSVGYFSSGDKVILNSSSGGALNVKQNPLSSSVIQSSVGMYLSADLAIDSNAAYSIQNEKTSLLYADGFSSTNIAENFKYRLAISTATSSMSGSPSVLFVLLGDDSSTLATLSSTLLYGGVVSAPFDKYVYAPRSSGSSGFIYVCDGATFTPLGSAIGNFAHAFFYKNASGEVHFVQADRGTMYTDYLITDTGYQQVMMAPITYESGSTITNGIMPLTEDGSIVITGTSSDLQVLELTGLGTGRVTARSIPQMTEIIKDAGIRIWSSSGSKSTAKRIILPMSTVISDTTATPVHISVKRPSSIDEVVDVFVYGTGTVSSDSTTDDFSRNLLFDPKTKSFSDRGPIISSSDITAFRSALTNPSATTSAIQIHAAYAPDKLAALRLSSSGLSNGSAINSLFNRDFWFVKETSWATSLTISATEPIASNFKDGSVTGIVEKELETGDVFGNSAVRVRTVLDNRNPLIVDPFKDGLNVSAKDEVVWADPGYIKSGSTEFLNKGVTQGTTILPSAGSTAREAYPVTNNLGVSAIKGIPQGETNIEVVAGSGDQTMQEPQNSKGVYGYQPAFLDETKQVITGDQPTQTDSFRIYGTPVTTYQTNGNTDFHARAVDKIRISCDMGTSAANYAVLSLPKEYNDVTAAYERVYNVGFVSPDSAGSDLTVPLFDLHDSVNNRDFNVKLKLPSVTANVTTVGSPSINPGSGAVTNLTADNYLTLPTAFNPGNQDFEVVMCFSLDSIPTDAKLFRCLERGYRLNINGDKAANKYNFSYATDDGDYNTWVTNAGTTDVRTSVKTWLKVVRSHAEGLDKLYVKFEGGDYTLETTAPIGYSGSSASSLGTNLELDGGTIYLAECYAEIDGERVWTGATSAGEYTISVHCDDASVTGTFEADDSPPVGTDSVLRLWSRWNGDSMDLTAQVLTSHSEHDVVLTGDTLPPLTGDQVTYGYTLSDAPRPVFLWHWTGVTANTEPTAVSTTLSLFNDVSHDIVAEPYFTENGMLTGLHDPYFPNVGLKVLTDTPLTESNVAITRGRIISDGKEYAMADSAIKPVLTAFLENPAKRTKLLGAALDTGTAPYDAVLHDGRLPALQYRPGSEGETRAADYIHLTGSDSRSDLLNLYVADPTFETGHWGAPTANISLVGGASGEVDTADFTVRHGEPWGDARKLGWLAYIEDTGGHNSGLGSTKYYSMDVSQASALSNANNCTVFSFVIPTATITGTASSFMNTPLTVYNSDTGTEAVSVYTSIYKDANNEDVFEIWANVTKANGERVTVPAITFEVKDIVVGNINVGKTQPWHYYVPLFVELWVNEPTSKTDSGSFSRVQTALRVYTGVTENNTSHRSDPYESIENSNTTPFRLAPYDTFALAKHPEGTTTWIDVATVGAGVCFTTEALYDSDDENEYDDYYPYNRTMPELTHGYPRPVTPQDLTSIWQNVPCRRCWDTTSIQSESYDIAALCLPGSPAVSVLPDPDDGTYNVNRVGTVVLKDGTATNITATGNINLTTNYITVTGANHTNDSYELCICFKTPATISKNSTYFWANDVLFGFFHNSNTGFSVKLNDGTTLSLFTGSALSANKKYWIKLIYTPDTGYAVHIHTSGDIFMPRATSDKTTPMLIADASAPSYIGYRPGYANTGGDVVYYLDECYVKVNGQYVWRGYTPLPGEYYYDVTPLTSLTLEDGDLENPASPNTALFDVSGFKDCSEIEGVFCVTLDSALPSSGGGAYVLTTVGNTNWSPSSLFGITIGTGLTFSSNAYMPNDSGGTTYIVVNSSWAEPQITIPLNTKVWLKAVYKKNTETSATASIYYSYDGISYNLAGEESFYTLPNTTEVYHMTIGHATVESRGVPGTVHLSECYIKADDTVVWRGATLVK